MSEKILGKYNRVDRCSLNDDEYEYKNCYLLTGYRIPSDFEVDLSGNCPFNELLVTNRTTVIAIDSLDELIDYVRSINSETAEKLETQRNQHPDYVLVGGSKDMKIYSDLSYGWATEKDIRKQNANIERD